MAAAKMEQQGRVPSPRVRVKWMCLDVTAAGATGDAVMDAASAQLEEDD